MSFLFENRSNEIDYSNLDSLTFLGSYQRVIPVNLNRMMENAYDWEHLPYVHAGNFSAIKLHSEGPWGWRAEVTLPNETKQQLELLVDRQQHYWITRVLSGSGKGFEIHTQAMSLSVEKLEPKIDVNVSFYMPSHFKFVFKTLNLVRKMLPFYVYKKGSAMLGIKGVEKSKHPRETVLAQLQSQYAVLYDEDERLMSGRQIALDRFKNHHNQGQMSELKLGDIDSLKQSLPHVFTIGKNRFCLNLWQGQWRLYSADCPHLHGPLEQADISDDGTIQCPWHGYQFDIRSGLNCSNEGGALVTPPKLIERHGQFFVSLE